MDHLQRASLDLAALNTLVLDEADRMLDMGFYDAVSYTHLRAHETVLDLVCRLLLEKKKNTPILYDHHVTLARLER